VKTRGSCAGRPAGAARRHGLPQGCPERTRAMEGTSISEQPPGIDVPVASRDQAIGSGPFTGAGTSRPTRCQRMSVDRASGEPKKRRSSPRRARKRPSDRRSSRSRQACRQARSRWRPDDREVVRRRPLDGEVATPLLLRGSTSKPKAVGLLTAAGKQSPEVVSISSARDVNVGCRSGVEAS
jgi:hypothetical protein